MAGDLSGQDDPLAVNENFWQLAGASPWHARAAGNAAARAFHHHHIAAFATGFPQKACPGRPLPSAPEAAPACGKSDLDNRARHALRRTGELIDLLALRAGDLSMAPDAVLYPRNEADVLAVLKLCAELGIAIIPFGSGGTGFKVTLVLRQEHRRKPEATIKKTSTQSSP